MKDATIMEEENLDNIKVPNLKWGSSNPPNPHDSMLPPLTNGFTRMSDGVDRPVGPLDPNWNKELAKDVDRIMEEKGRSTRDKTRAACYTVYNALRINGTLQRGWNRVGEIVNLQRADRGEPDTWFTGMLSGKTLPINRVLLNLGIIPSDSLYKAIPAYLEAVVKMSDKMVSE